MVSRVQQIDMGDGATLPPPAESPSCSCGDACAPVTGHETAPARSPGALGLDPAEIEDAQGLRAVTAYALLVAGAFRAEIHVRGRVLEDAQRRTARSRA